MSAGAQGRTPAAKPRRPFKPPITPEIGSVTLDRRALTVGIAYIVCAVASGFVAWHWVLQDMIVLAGALTMALAMFLLLAYGWLRASRARAAVDRDGVRRLGKQQGWDVDWASLQGIKLVESWGQTFLVVNPGGKGRHASAALVKGAGKPQVAVPLTPERVGAVRAALVGRGLIG